MHTLVLVAVECRGGKASTLQHPVGWPLLLLFFFDATFFNTM